MWAKAVVITKIAKSVITATVHAQPLRHLVKLVLKDTSVALEQPVTTTNARSMAQLKLALRSITHRRLVQVSTKSRNSYVKAIMRKELVMIITVHGDQSNCSLSSREVKMTMMMMSCVSMSSLIRQVVARLRDK